MKRIISIILVTVFAVFAFSACEEKKTSNAQKEGQKQTEQAFSQQSKAVPYPVTELRDSLERRNLRERLIRTNKPNAIGYVYLLSFGKPLGYYTVKGKVSSTQSQMTTTDLVVKADYGEGWESQTVPAPGDDGSYGPNEDGVFFFTTENVMVTTNLDYVWSDNPLPFDVPELDAKK